LAAGFAVLVTITLILSIVAILSLRNAVESKDRVINVNSKILQEAQTLFTADMKMSSDTRGYVLSREDRFLDRVRESRRNFESTLERVNRLIYTDEARRWSEGARQAGANYVSESEKVFDLVRRGAKLEVIGDAFEEHISPARDRVDQQIAGLIEHEK